LPVGAVTETARGARFGLARLREHQWTPVERAILISAIATVMGALFVTSYSLALGDPVPHRIDAALIGDARTHGATRPSRPRCMPSTSRTSTRHSI
jgi:hypothetical protein